MAQKFHYPGGVDHILPPLPVIKAAYSKKNSETFLENIALCKDKWYNVGKEQRGGIQTKDKIYRYATCDQCKKKGWCPVDNQYGCFNFVPINKDAFWSSVLEDLKNRVNNDNYHIRKPSNHIDAFEAIISDALLCLRRNEPAYLFTLEQVETVLGYWAYADTTDVYWNDGIYTLVGKHTPKEVLDGIKGDSD